MRYRYFARSRPGSFDQPDRCASCAATTARFTSAFEACATFASGSSVAGLMTVKVLRGFDGPELVADEEAVLGLDADVVGRLGCRGVLPRVVAGGEAP